MEAVRCEKQTEGFLINLQKTRELIEIEKKKLNMKGSKGKSMFTGFGTMFREGLTKQRTMVMGALGTRDIDEKALIDGKITEIQQLLDDTKSLKDHKESHKLRIKLLKA